MLSTIIVVRHIMIVYFWKHVMNFFLPQFVKRDPVLCKIYLLSNYSQALNPERCILYLIIKQNFQFLAKRQTDQRTLRLFLINNF